MGNSCKKKDSQSSSPAENGSTKGEHDSLLAPGTAGASPNKRLTMWGLAFMTYFAVCGGPFGLGTFFSASNMFQSYRGTLYSGRKIMWVPFGFFANYLLPIEPAVKAGYPFYFIIGMVLIPWIWSLPMYV
jgi:hypothetical protein